MLMTVRMVEGRFGDRCKASNQAAMGLSHLPEQFQTRVHLLSLEALM
jgi:hypothetical protein